MTNQHYTTNPGVLAVLRSLVPPRRLGFEEALQVAELQANRLLELTDVSDWPVPDQVVTDLPRVRIELRDLPTSGLSFWDGQTWVICLNASEPRSRQRFTLLHEFKHIVDHTSRDRLYTGQGRRSADEQAEHAADYFAGCVLMPKRLLKRAWGNGLQRPAVLARLFGTSSLAVDVRLSQLGLTEPRRRCAPAASIRPSRRVTYARSPHRQGAAA